MKLDARFILNLVAFQVGWFACVIGGANDLAIAGPLAVTAAIALHVLFVADNPRQELKLVVIAVLIGVVWDSAVVSLGLMSYPSGTFLPGIAPYWILAMWALFATTLNVSMNWLKGRPWLAFLMGGLGGPLAYLTGYRLGGVEIPDLWLGLVTQGAGWAVLMPLLARLAARFNGIQTRALQAATPATAGDKHHV